MQLKFTKYLAASLLLAVSCVATADTVKQNNTTTNNFIAISDIHFNPFYVCQKTISTCLLINELNKADASQWNSIFQKYDSSISPYYYDTNFGLLKETLTAVKQAGDQSSAKFILMPGDFIAHNFQQNYQRYSGDSSQKGYQAFVKKTMQFLTLEIQNSQTIPVYPAIGNNDSYNGDYAVVPSGDYLKDMTTLWQPLLGKANGNFAKNFPAAGYYSFSPNNTPTLKIIVLDTVLFARPQHNVQVDEAAQQQLTWLTNELQQAQIAKQKVWLVMHIPPGMDVYSTVKNPFSSVLAFWLPAYSKMFTDVLTTYQANIEGLISSHTHMDGFQVISLTKNLPDSFVPGVSPLFGNNPGFKIYQYTNNNYKISNFTTYFFPENEANGKWQQEYIFNNVYQPNCSQCNVVNGMQALSTTGSLAQAYQQYYAMSNTTSQPINQGKWLPYYWCGIHNQNEGDYLTCVSDQK